MSIEEGHSKVSTKNADNTAKACPSSGPSFAGRYRFGWPAFVNQEFANSESRPKVW